MPGAHGAFPGAPSVASSDARGNVGCVKALPGSYKDKPKANQPGNPAQYAPAGGKKPEAPLPKGENGEPIVKRGAFPGAPSIASSDSPKQPKGRPGLGGPKGGEAVGKIGGPGSPGTPAGPKKAVPEHEKKPPQEMDIKAMLLDQFRKTVQKRAGSGGITALARSFRLADRDKSGKIDAEEMVVALSRFGMKTDEKGAKMLLKVIDADGSGKVDQTEFLNAVRGPMNKRRVGMVDMAFKVLDKTGDGIITIDDLSSYNTSHDPDVKSGKKTREEALGDLLHNFDGNGDGTVTKKEFREYYKSVSSSIDNDDYFELMIRNAWHIPGGKGFCANTSNARVLVDFSDGEQKVVCIDNDLGLDLHNRTQVIERLKKQGVKNIMDYHVSG